MKDIKKKRKKTSEKYHYHKSLYNSKGNLLSKYKIFKKFTGGLDPVEMGYAFKRESYIRMIKKEGFMDKLDSESKKFVLKIIREEFDKMFEDEDNDWEELNED